MSLTNNTSGIYVNLVRGKFAVKEKNRNGEDQVGMYDNLTGRIIGVQFKEDQYNGQEFTVAVFEIVDNQNTYLLQIRVDSGYFRTLCNSLRSADVNRIVTLSGIYTKTNNKTKTVLFVKQDGKTLKHYFTKDNMGELPALEKVTYNNKDRYDSTKQQQFWMDWLTSLNLGNKQQEQSIIQQDMDEEMGIDGEEFDDEPPF